MRSCRALRFPVIVLACSGLVATAPALEAQARSPAALPTASAESADPAPTTIRVCYLPLVGAFYVIGETGLAKSCLSLGIIQHVPISWERAGPKGDVGPAGEAGPAGAAGPAGEPGDMGPPGVTGPPGEAGAKGERGDKGPPGVSGLPGDKGPIGDEGPTGAAGAMGDKGPIGDAGPPGAPGAPGDKGLGGAQGLPGEKGPLGAQGPAGDPGPIGDPGLPGDKGPVGDKGPPGPQGVTGDKGPQGPAGPDGLGLPCDNGCVTTPIIANLAVTDAKLSPITEPGKILNSATTATSANVANRIVARGAAGEFTAGIVTATALNMAGVRPDVWHGNLAGTSLLYATGSTPQGSGIFFGQGAGTSGIFVQPLLVALGSGANRSTSGASSTAVGFEALNGGSSFATAVVGAQASDNGSFPGERHVVVGFRSARFMSGDGPSLARRNIVLGPEAGTNIFTHANVLIIGRTQAAAFTITIGTDATHSRTFIAGIEDAEVSGAPVLVSSTGQLGVAASSARFKENIHPISGHEALALASLRPVRYRYRSDIETGAAPLHFGLIAEEVAQVAPDLVVRDSAGGAFTVRYDLLVPLLVAQVQQRRADLERLRAQSEAIRLRIEQLERRAATRDRLRDP